MSNYETSKALAPSEEVEAYPLVIKLCSINWAELFAERPDSDRSEGFAIAAAYCSHVVEDLVECRAIGKISGIYQGCSRPFNKPLEFAKPTFHPF